VDLVESYPVHCNSFWPEVDLIAGIDRREQFSSEFQPSAYLNQTPMFSRKVAIPEPQAEPAHTKSRHAAEEQVEQPNVSHPVTPRTPLTPSSISSSSEEANNERGMVVHEKNNELVPAGKQNNALSLVTVRSMSQEERDKLTHLEVARK
jgi:hypothetical protein